MTAPTRTGTPMSSTAPWIRAAAPASRNGSTSEAFSGQIDQAGLGLLAGRDRRQRAPRSRQRGCLQHGLALGVEVQPQPRDVALDDGHGEEGRRPTRVGSPPGPAHRPPGRPQHRRRPPPQGDQDRALQRRPPPPAGRRPARRRTSSAGRHPRTARPSVGPSTWLKASPPPGETAEWPAAAHRLLGHPQAPDPERPAAQPLDEGQPEGQRDDVQRLVDRQHQPRQRTDVDPGPVHERDEQPEARLRTRRGRRP